MPKLTILRGVSGSGKSTWARNVPGAVVVSRDDLRVLLAGTDGPDYYKVDKDVLRGREEVVTVMQNAMIENLLKAGKDVIVDNTNIEWKFVKEIAKVGNRVGAEVEVKVFDVPLQRAINNDMWRAAKGGRAVGREIITRQHQRFQGNKGNVLDPAFVPKPYNGTPNKRPAILVDVDGTLAHMKDRSPFDWKRVGEDEVDEVISNLVRLLDLDYTIIVMSGRDSACRAETKDWLDKHDIPFDFLFMRPEKDGRADNIIKAELFDTFVRDNFDVKFVLDDRQQVVDMWRSMGLTCLQVAPGDF